MSQNTLESSIILDLVMYFLNRYQPLRGPSSGSSLFGLGLPQNKQNMDLVMALLLQLNIAHAANEAFLPFEVIRHTSL